MSTMGYQSRYERYIMLDVERGRLVRTAIVSDAELQRQEAGRFRHFTIWMTERFSEGSRFSWPTSKSGKSIPSRLCRDWR